MFWNFGILTRTVKRVNTDDESVIKEQYLFCNHSPVFEYFSILTININGLKVIWMRSLLINRGNPSMNKNNQSLPLEVLDNQGIEKRTSYDKP